MNIDFNITLDKEYVAQQEFKSNQAQVILIDDDLQSKRMKVLVEIGGNNSFRYWVYVLDESNYTLDWTDEMITNAVKNYFA